MKHNEVPRDSLFDQSTGVLSSLNQSTTSSEDNSLMIAKVESEIHIDLHPDVFPDEHGPDCEDDVDVEC